MASRSALSLLNADSRMAQDELLKLRQVRMKLQHSIERQSSKMVKISDRRTLQAKGRTLSRGRHRPLNDDIMLAMMDLTEEC
ncbi:hypothetical protein KCV07_g179, partial [Aureobasidium melanogenum]